MAGEEVPGARLRGHDGVGWDEIDKYLDFIGRGSPLIAGVVQNGYSNAKLATSVMGLLIGKTPKAD